jgi:hypothetical protein
MRAMITGLNPMKADSYFFFTECMNLKPQTIVPFHLPQISGEVSYARMCSDKSAPKRLS